MSSEWPVTSERQLWWPLPICGIDVDGQLLGKNPKKISSRPATHTKWRKNVDLAELRQTT